MACIEKKIILKGSKGETEKIALFDSGVTYSCIEKNIATADPMKTPALKLHLGHCKERMHKIGPTIKISV